MSVLSGPVLEMEVTHPVLCYIYSWDLRDPAFLVSLAQSHTALRLFGREHNCILFKKKQFYLLIFRKRGREGEREGEKHQCVVASHQSATGDLACNPGMCPDWELNQQPFGLHHGAQSTEPHQPGHIVFFYFNILGLNLVPAPSPLYSQKNRELWGPQGYQEGFLQSPTNLMADNHHHCHMQRLAECRAVCL